jgi:uncharacterized protein YcbK (DUF882 family)
VFEYSAIAASVRKLRDLGKDHISQPVRMLGAAAVLVSALSVATSAAAETRSLKLLFTHTGEKATITFKRDGKFDQKGLAQVNRILRDWRRNEPAKMDPRLLDLVWEVYQRTGSSNYINVVSAYRSPKTNNMLRGRSRSSGVAKNSQHTLGKAMDFYIPGVKLATLRKIAMQMQVGGVGYYPTSGSPFVHLDVGNVRAWPRMSRKELVSIFPKGKTMHLPADGRPLPGYDYAVADYKRRVGSKSIVAASTVGTANGLVTALLPKHKSRAEEALDLQTSAQASVKPPEFFDLAAIDAPLPIFRSPEMEPSVIVGTSAFIPSSSFKVMRGLSMTGRALRQPTADESALFNVRHQGAWNVSGTVIREWALAPAEAHERLALPAGLQRAFASADDLGNHGKLHPSAAFNADRFGSDG